MNSLSVDMQLISWHEKFCHLEFSMLVNMSSLSVDMKMCQLCISRHEHCVSWHKEFIFYFSLCQSTWVLCWSTWRIQFLFFLCQSTWALCWSTWRLVKTCFSLFYISIDFKHVFNKCIYLKHFKHTIKYKISPLNILESSKSRRSIRCLR